MSTMTANYHLERTDERLHGKVQHLDTNSYTIVIGAGGYQGVTYFLSKEQVAPAVAMLHKLAQELGQALVKSLGLPTEDSCCTGEGE